MMGKRPKHTKRNKRILRSAGAALLFAAVGGGGVASAFPGPYHAPYAANPIGAIHLLSGEEKRIDLTSVFADLDGDIDWGSFAVEGGGSMTGVDQTDPAHPQLVLRAPYEGIDAVRLWLRGRDKAGHEAAEEIYVGYGELTAKPGAGVLGFPAGGMAPHRVEMSSLFQSLAGPEITLTAIDGETVTRATYYELAPSGTAGFRKVTLTAADPLDREAVVELTARFGSAPSAAGSIPDQLIGEQGVTLPLSEWFTDADLADPTLEDRLTYSAELVGREEDLYGYKPVPVQLEVNGETGLLEMSGRFPGTSLVRVTATDRAGWSASLIFTATVPPLTVYRGDRLESSELPMGTVYVVPDDAVADTPLTEADLIRWQVGRLRVEGWGTVQSFDTGGLADGLYRAYHVYNGTMLSNPYYFRVLELKDDPAAAPVDIEDVLTYYSARQDVNGDHRSTREDLALLMPYIGMGEREPRVWQVTIPANVTS